MHGELIVYGQWFHTNSVSMECLRLKCPEYTHWETFDRFYSWRPQSEKASMERVHITVWLSVIISLSFFFVLGKSYVMTWIFTWFCEGNGFISYKSQFDRCNLTEKSQRSSCAPCLVTSRCVDWDTSVPSTDSEFTVFGHNAVKVGWLSRWSKSPLLYMDLWKAFFRTENRLLACYWFG